MTRLSRICLSSRPVFLTTNIIKELNNNEKRFPIQYAVRAIVIIVIVVILVSASCGLFALAAGGFKCQGVILVELIERFDGIYSPSDLLWVFTTAYLLGCLFSKPLFLPF